MSDKINQKKSKEKSKGTVKNRAEKNSNVEKKAQKTASSKARKTEEKAIKKAKEEVRKLERKAKKASNKEKQMAKSVSKKRLKKQAKIKYERHMKREEAVSYFISLITGLKKGNVQFKQGKDAVVITPAELVDVEIKAEIKGKMEKVTFEMAWLAKKSQDISISSS